MCCVSLRERLNVVLLLFFCDIMVILLCNGVISFKPLTVALSHYLLLSHTNFNFCFTSQIFQSYCGSLSQVLKSDVLETDGAVFFTIHVPFLSLDQVLKVLSQNSLISIQ